MNHIYIPATKPEDWSRFLAEPKHWKKGYSAMSLALCWQEANGFPESVKSVFNQSEYDLFHDIEMLLAIPEHQVPLPGGSASSQNDIFVLAKGNKQLVSIALEGKVSEPFGDKSVFDWYKEPSPGKMKRLKFLCCELDMTPDAVMDVRYQLLHRTVSAIIEAQRFNAPNALMLVHSFSPTDEWFDDFATFAKLFEIDPRINGIHKAGNIRGIELYLGWVKGEEKYLSMEPSFSTANGIVTSRKCDSCGHHEIGINTDSGVYMPFKTGMRVSIHD